MNKLNSNFSKAWIVAVNMGYGHQRTAYSLKHLSPDGKFINANDYSGIPKFDNQIWEQSRRFYEFISNFQQVPYIGNFVFKAYDRYQKISEFYPSRDLSEPNFATKQIYKLIKKGWGKHLIEKLENKSLPFVSTFFIPVFMADFFDYPGDIYCVVADADISRSWAPFDPSQSRIKYFAPNERVVERLKLYGVKPENIFFTGYPLPKENIGSFEKQEIVKNDLRERILNLDPKKQYRKVYESLVKKYVGVVPNKPSRKLTIMFSVGGAGAQKKIGFEMLKSLKEKVITGEINLIFSVGTREKAKDYFLGKIKKLGLENYIEKNIEIIFEDDIYKYFAKFNEILRRTDVLWTKPSELSFYSALGIPIIMAPSLGSQENFNRDWLIKIGSGVPQENPNYTGEWLMDFIDSGFFTESAVEGFIEAEVNGTFNIEKIITKNK